MKLKLEFKWFAGWGQCLRSHSLPGPQATLLCWTPIPGSSLPAGHATGSLPQPTIQDLASRGWEEPKLSFTLSLFLPVCLSLLGQRKDPGHPKPLKKSLFLWACLHEAIFVCTQTHVYKQLSADYHTGEGIEGIFRISSTKYFFSSGSQTSAVTNKEHEMGGQKL